MERTENVELTVLCLIQDGDWILLQNRLYQGLKMPGSITNIGGEYGMRIEKRLYTAAEVIVIIKDKWKEKPEIVKEYVDFIESIKMRPSERFKLNNSSQAGLLYSAYDDWF